MIPNDSNYDSELHLVWALFKGPGYHSLLKDGTPVHDIRQSAEYALECLCVGGSERVQRAADILDRLCSLQDADPVSPTYGIWSWTYEETLAQMSPPDWNWADFIGARLAQALKQHAKSLPPATVADVRSALSHAAGSIFRRNVSATYTNIAIMGAVVAAAAGELLDQPVLLAYARRRFQSLKESVQRQGSFNEYNSPTYTVVAIEELDRLALMVRDHICRDLGEFLWHHAWEVVSEHFHPPTGQWAGPHARAYSDLLRPRTVRWLSAATGLELGQVASDDETAKSLEVLPPRPCPQELVDRFQRLPEPELTVRRMFQRSDSGSTVGTTWMNGTACLASVNCEHTWVQRRFLLGYWTTPGGVAILKMSVLLNGREFPGFGVVQQQERTRVLTVLRPLYGTGEYHPTLNAVPSGCFEVSDLRIRYSLCAVDAMSQRLPDGRIVMTAGEWQACIHPAAGAFNGTPVRWDAGTLEGGCCADGVLYSGETRTLNLKEACLQAAIGLDLVDALEKAPTETVQTELVEGTLTARWQGLSVATPTCAANFVL